MNRPRSAALALALLAPAAAAGCGHSQGASIPRSQASDIIGRLQEAQRRSTAHACHDLRTDTIPALEAEVSGLPQNVDSNVRTTLSDGVAHLKDLVQQQCAAPAQTNTTPTTPTTPTTTVPTTPPVTTTVPQVTPTPRTTPTPSPGGPTTSTTTTTSPGGVPAPGNSGNGNGGAGNGKGGGKGGR